MRKLLFTAAAAIIAWAMLVVPLPLLALVPVAATPVADILEVVDDDAELAEPIPDSVRFTAVLVQPASAVGAIEVWFDEHRSLTFAPNVVPRGVDPDEFVDLQVRMFEESVRTAAAIGMRAAGADVTITGDGARIERTIPGTPAAGVLERGDVIVAVDSTPVRLASELAADLSAREAGEEVELTLRRGGEEVLEQVRIGQLPEGAGAGLGVLATTVDLVIDTPVEVRPRADAAVGGPSAGLLVALGLYEATGEADLVGDRVVAGTGTIDTSANVGPVDGIREKVRGAELAGADVFLVPATQAHEARAAAPDGLEVVPVETLQDAIDALER